ncbi:MAG: DUF4270 domain-containing protein, partial [Muribaculaceae bacterium]|nr:DUF4270 domain-containing protein [Muribaculaceae bacterium]
MMRQISMRKLLQLLAAPFIGIAVGGVFASCVDNVSTVGSDLATGEVQIALDSLTWDGTEQYIHRGDQKIQVACPQISYSTIFDDAVDSRSTTNLIGRITVPEYGDLNCSYVSQLLSTTKLDIPDSIPIAQIDSMKLILRVPRGELTGDSLAPQQLRVYRLTKSLPKDINNKFDPSGYYDPENPLGSRSFTLSALGMSDSLYQKRRYVDIEIPLSREMAVETVNAYRDEKTKSIFEWPQTFEQHFHGIYVEPSFGRGCIANIGATRFLIYYNYKTVETTTTDDKTTTTLKTETGVAGVFASSPIVLNSNNINYQPSDYLKNLAADNEAIITTPGGYRINLKFPAKELLDIYYRSQSKLAVVNNLSFSIPAEEIKNDYGLTLPPYLIMVKTTKLSEFLASNSLPDDNDSFYAEYDNGSYTFSKMRNYILNLIQNGVKEEDLDFTIIPANIEFEEEQTSSSYYSSLYYSLYGYNTSSSGKKYPTKCTPYITKPSMCKLHMDKARALINISEPTSQ